jgi:hypothetical protein
MYFAAAAAASLPALDALSETRGERFDTRQSGENQVPSAERLHLL